MKNTMLEIMISLCLTYIMLHFIERLYIIAYSKGYCYALTKWNITGEDKNVLEHPLKETVTNDNEPEKDISNA